MSGMNGYSPTQVKILQLLSDGKPHTREEIHALLIDELCQIEMVSVHISRIRKHLRPKGEEIICELANRRIHYRHVRLLPSAYDGRT